MKSIFTASIFCSLALISTVFASQQIDCKIINPPSSNSVSITLTSDQAGTFSMQSNNGIDTSSSSEDSDDPTTLVLKRDGSTATTASFSAHTDLPTGSGSVQFTLLLPMSQISKASASFPASLSTSISQIGKAGTQDLVCSSKI